ncbi:MAG: hypothetical protein JRJ47_06260 [Deltaproteobacteria bacterium]|nr:hypothetical protein [Deltaproteobacteria bacterium]
MSYKWLGLLFFAGGLLIWALGALVAKKYHAETNFRGVGCVRITWAGFGYLCGCVLTVFGVCFMLSSLFLMFS